MKSLSEELGNFAQLCEEAGLSPLEKAEALKGAQFFFERGWPSNFVSTGWALHANRGLLPPEYKGLNSVAQYASRILHQR